MDNLRKYAKKSSGYYIHLIVAFAFLAGLIGFIFIQLFNVSKKNVLNIGHLNSVQIAQDVKYYMIEEKDEIALAGHTIEIMLEAGKGHKEILEYLRLESKLVTETIDENYTGIYGYFDGQYLDGSGWVPPLGYKPNERPWYIAAYGAKGKVAYVTPYVDAETGNLMLSISKLLADRKSVISLDVALDRIQKIINNRDFSEYDRIIIADKGHTVVAAKEKELLGKNIASDPMIKAFSTKAGSDIDKAYEYTDQEGIIYTVFPSAVEGQWNVFLIKSSSKLMNSLYYLYAILGFGTIAFFVIVFQIFAYVNKRRKMAENLNVQLESIADIYISVHKYNLEKDELQEIRCLPYVREQINIAKTTCSSNDELFEKVMTALIQEDYWQDLRNFIDLSTLSIRLGNSNTISQEILGLHGWVKARIVVLERKNDKITSILWMFENIDEEKRKQSELRYLSEIDLMTGIRNRGSGERLIKEQLEQRNEGIFCLMDADNFKAINDTYGHGVGDAVIKAIASCLQKVFAGRDVVMRLGGDEFAVYALDITDKAVAEKVLKRLIKELDKVVIPSFEKKRKIEMSIGVGFFSADSNKDFETLYKEADKAVYRSKKIQGSSICFYDEQLDK